MKSLTRISILGLVAGAGMIACADQYTEEIARIHDMNAAIDSIEQVMLGIDTSEAETIWFNVGTDLQFLQTRFSDTVDIETGKLLDLYYRTGKGVKQFRSQYNALNEHVVYSRDQLWRLEENLKINKWERSEGAGYVDDEAAVLDQMRLDLTILVDGFNRAVFRYDSLKPLIDQMITELETSMSE